MLAAVMIQVVTLDGMQDPHKPEITASHGVIFRRKHESAV